LRKSKPQGEDELKCVVEGEPVHSVDGALKDGQEGEHNPVLRIISEKTAIEYPGILTVNH
jgi:hypothetical protein